jgi:xanthine dehydrogenase accessory factor
MSANPSRYGGDFEVLSTLVAWLRAGERAALVTVLRTWGSSPRPPGSLLAIRYADGHTVGSVSGGCVEEDLVSRYMQGDLPGYPTVVDYGVDPAGAARIGLPCGGRLELLIEEPGLEGLEPVLEVMQAGSLLERSVHVDSGEFELSKPLRVAEFVYEGGVLRKCFGPDWQLVMVGGGQLADYLARIALTLGFHVWLCDPREQYDSRVPEVVLSRRMPDDLLAELTPRTRAAVVTLAHDPKLDDMALMEALRGGGFFYVGALGSQRSSAARRKRLLTLGISEAELAGLRAPVGIDIGSHTPAEIAVAIAADLVAARHGVETRR